MTQESKQRFINELQRLTTHEDPEIAKQATELLARVEFVIVEGESHPRAYVANAADLQAVQAFFFHAWGHPSQAETWRDLSDEQRKEQCREYALWQARESGLLPLELPS